MLIDVNIRALDPNGPSAFPVSWAGESESNNRIHTAREYTEKWLHQQQIRDAIGDTSLMSADVFEASSPGTKIITAIVLNLNIHATSILCTKLVRYFCGKY